MTAKHTPGPWVARPDPNAFLSDDWCIGLADSLANIDKVAVCSERDARLIAAAPELLDALIALLGVAPSKAPGAGLIVGAEEKHANALQAARAAIKKATGDA